MVASCHVETLLEGCAVIAISRIPDELTICRIRNSCSVSREGIPRGGGGAHSLVVYKSRRGEVVMMLIPTRNKMESQIEVIHFFDTKDEEFPFVFHLHHHILARLLPM